MGDLVLECIIRLPKTGRKVYSGCPLVQLDPPSDGVTLWSWFEGTVAVTDCAGVPIGGTIEHLFTCTND